MSEDIRKSVRKVMFSCLSILTSSLVAAWVWMIAWGDIGPRFDIRTASYVESWLMVLVLGLVIWILTPSNSDED